jgi:hypothetical protein
MKPALAELRASQRAARGASQSLVLTDLRAACAALSGGRITTEVCRTMEAHVEGCPACAARCRALRAVLSTCSSSPSPKLPVALPRTVADQIKRSLKVQTS